VFWSQWKGDKALSNTIMAKKGVFVSVWTSADDFWTSTVQKRDKLSNDRLYKIVIILASAWQVSLNVKKVIINYTVRPFPPLTTFDTTWRHSSKNHQHSSRRTPETPLLGPEAFALRTPLCHYYGRVNDALLQCCAKRVAGAIAIYCTALT